MKNCVCMVHIVVKCSPCNSFSWWSRIGADSNSCSSIDVFPIIPIPCFQFFCIFLNSRI